MSEKFAISQICKVEFECRFMAWLEKSPNATEIDVGHKALVGIDRTYELETNQTDLDSFCLERGMIPRLGQNVNSKSITSYASQKDMKSHLEFTLVNSAFFKYTIPKIKRSASS